MAEDRLIRIENLRRLMQQRDWTTADLARAAGGRYTYWRDVLAGGDKSFGEKAARKLEESLELRPRGVLDTPGAFDLGVAQPLALYKADPVPTKEWETIGMKGQEVPALFKCAVPDDALAPRTPRGTVFTFDVRAKPAPGLVVLVEDGEGVRYVRRYTQGVGGRWAASAGEGYATLHSDEHALKLLAVAVSRWDGAG